jgi:hypothetical protein
LPAVQLILVEEEESKCDVERERRSAIWQSEQILGQKILPGEIRPTLRGSRYLVNPKTCVGHPPKCLTIMASPIIQELAEEVTKSQ